MNKDHQQLLEIVGRLLEKAQKYYGKGDLPSDLAHLLEFELLPEYKNLKCKGADQND